jgi:hypothetical protein
VPTPTAAQLLQVWERAGDQSAAAIGLLLLGCCCPDLPEAELAALPLGQRDARLLQLRRELFGPEICGVANCPYCATVVEASFRCDDLLLSPDRPDADQRTRRYFSSAHGMQVVFRLVDSNDLFALEHCDADVARQRLLDRCVISTGTASEAHGADGFPVALQAEIAQAMSQADPQADVQLALCCPACGKSWQPAFDIARFLWTELHAWALRMLRDVDTLAHAYHWPEADILALNPRRRQVYLELCAS